MPGPLVLMRLAQFSFSPCLDSAAVGYGVRSRKVETGHGSQQLEAR